MKPIVILEGIVGAAAVAGAPKHRVPERAQRHPETHRTRSTRVTLAAAEPAAHAAH